MNKLVSVILLAISILVAGSVWLWHDYQHYINTALELDNPINITIEKGSNFNNLIDNLSRTPISVNKFYLKIYGRQSGLATQIKAGNYRVDSAVTPIELLEIFAKGKTISYKVTLIEGSTFRQMRQMLANNPYLTDDISQLTETELIYKLGIKHRSIEGLFLAETYQIEKNSSALDLLKRAHKLLEVRLTESWQQRKEKLPYQTPYHALIMASIIEKETGLPAERPRIAGVFVRRLHKKMKLQTDPTVIYGMGDAYKGNIRRSDLRRPTAYNTYIINGLPPTPIAIVGVESINAALNPLKDKSLFFVAKGDGSHHFSATLEEHNKAVRRYQLSSRKQYRSSPKSEPANDS